MKLLYVTDTHIRGTSPRHRLDDFPATLLTKCREVVTLCREHQVAALLHGGDLFDRPDTAPAVAMAYIDALRQAPCPIITVAGNHDLFGYNPETLSRTMLGLFAAFGLVRLLRPGDVAWLEQGGLRVQVTGQEFHPDIDRRENRRLDYCVFPEGSPGALHERRPAADFAVHLTHGMLLEKAFFEGMAYTSTRCWATPRPTSPWGRTITPVGAGITLMSAAGSGAIPAPWCAWASAAPTWSGSRRRC